MRSAVFLCASALILTIGCAASGPNARLTAERQWDALCCRMPQGRVDNPLVQAHRNPPTIEQQGRLQKAASQAFESVVQVKTSFPCPQCSQPHGTTARTASNDSGGTGVVITSDGLILTNAHVVRHAGEVSVVTWDGVEHAVEAIITHPHLDMAVLRIDQTQMRAAWPSRRLLRSGTPVVAVSFRASRRGRTYRSGVVTQERTSLQRELDPSGRTDYGTLVETTVNLEPGFSGGPLLDTRGNLVGLNVAVTGAMGSGQSRGYAMPLNQKSHEAIAQLVRLARAGSSVSH